MELLILLLLSPAVLAQLYGKSNDPNDEPFLPIHPIYPYSPKLIKRGADREAITHLTAELYAPKVDARDSYSASYSANYPRDPYYPNYNPYPKVSTASAYSSPSPYSSSSTYTTPSPYSSPSTYSSYYNSVPYSQSNAPYSAHNGYTPSYTMAPSPYSPVPYSASYPSYYYQPPYYQPNYYNQPLYLPPPPPPPPGYSGSTDSYSESESTERSKDKKSSGNQKDKDNERSQDYGYQFSGDGNYLNGNSKDLDGQSSSYKASSPQNQLEPVNDLQLRNLPIPLPKTTYKVISVAGQPVGPDYPLPPSYMKAQQLEDIMSQTLAKLIAQNSQQQSSQQQAAQEQQQEAPKIPMRTNDDSYQNQNNYNKDPQRYVSLPNVLAKTGLAYVINPNMLGKVNIGQSNGQVYQPTTTLTKSTKYSPLTRVQSEQSHGYAPPDKSEKVQGSNDYDSYDNPSAQNSQSYDNATPLTYNYQDANYNSPQSQQQLQQLYKTNLEDVNFGSKQTNKV